MKLKLTFLILPTLIIAAIVQAGNTPPRAGIEVKLLDVHARIYTDRFPEEENCLLPINVPRNYSLHFQLAIKSEMAGQCEIKLIDLKDAEGKKFTGAFTVNRLLPVHVEGNTQGSMINHPGGEPPASWKPYFIRMAPFDVFEAVQESTGSSISLSAGQVAAVLLQIDIPANSPPGIYSGKLIVKAVSGTTEVPVSFVVNKVVVPAQYFLQCTHWLSARPENLVSGPPPAWWSERHWQLLARAGKLLRENGDNVMFTPLINTKYPLIQPLKDKNGNISFDYSRFDRWVDMFEKMGFIVFAGDHLVTLNSDLFIKTASTGKEIEFEKAGTGLDWFAFLELFLKDFYKHLEKKNLLSRYYQHIYDEPAQIDKYKQYNEILKRSMPGIPSIDAINSRPAMFTDMVGIQVFNFAGINLQKNKVVKERLAEGKKLWLYNCSSPYPPYPNRHLDLPLTENRLWPWLSYKYGATGYLWWAANLYRGVADEYKTSLGATPGGTQLHPPGDAWLYYRSPKGLIPSLRIISFREGMIDVTLLNMASKKDTAGVERIISELVHPPIALGHERRFADYKTTAETIPKGYETDPAIFNKARKEILDILDK